METKKNTEQTEQQVSRISELHLEKIHDQIRKSSKVDQLAAEVFQKEFQLKRQKLELDSMQTENVIEYQKLMNELQEVYGKVNINPETGEYSFM